MSKVRCLVSSALLALAGLGAARADERMLAAGDPPLTQGMVDDYCRYFAWRTPAVGLRAEVLDLGNRSLGTQKCGHVGREVHRRQTVDNTMTFVTPSMGRSCILKET